MDDKDLDQLIARARAGDEGAAAEFLQRFENHIRIFVRSKLPRALRSRFDSMDFVQAVWKSTLWAEGPDLTQFQNARHLIRYLSGIARNKINEEYRRRTRTGKYDLAREEPLYVRRGDRDVPRDVPSSTPSPSDGAQERDRLSTILRGLSPLQRQMVELRRQGLTFVEVGSRLGLNESAVRRTVESIRERLERTM